MQAVFIRWPTADDGKQHLTDVANAETWLRLMLEGKTGMKLIKE
jgi:hypothetical protein